MPPIAVAFLLLAVLLLVMAAMVWQAAKKVPDATPTYVVEEVVPFVFERLSEDACTRIDQDDVQRILEWEVFYLQRAGRSKAGPGSVPVAGSTEAATYVRERSARQGYDYRMQDIREVQQYETVYLAEIGAIGPIAEEAP